MVSARPAKEPPLTQSLLRAELDIFSKENQETLRRELEGLKASLVNEVVERLKAQEAASTDSAEEDETLNQSSSMRLTRSRSKGSPSPQLSPKKAPPALGAELDEAASQQPLIASGEGHDEVRHHESECCESEVWQYAWFQKLSGFVKGNVFESLAGLLVTLSIFWLLWGTDYKARHWLSEDPDSFLFVETFFLVGFGIEICLRIGVFGIQSFFCGPGGLANNLQNWLDFLLVMIQLIDVLQQMTDLGQGKTHWAHMLRILRMIRIIRLLRVFRFFPDLRMLLVSVLQSFVPLVWVLLLIMGFTTILAIVITVVVTEHKTLKFPKGFDDWNDKTPDESDERNLQEFFGTVPRTILSLYGAIAGGRDWHESSEPLAVISPYMIYVFVMYTFFVIFAMMNVITSQFVDQTLEASAKDRRESMVNNLMDAFSRNTKGSKDLVSEEDFMQNLKHPSMRSFLKDLYKREEVSAEEIQKSRLFEMLDDDGSGEITKDELVLGCVKLTGSATSLDLAVLKLDVEAVRRDVGILVRQKPQGRSGPAPRTPLTPA